MADLCTALFHTRPACEQEALPTLSLLPGKVSIRVLPGDKIYQAMEIEPDFMRPVILHGFGTNAKRRLPTSLAGLAQHGWLPMAAALFGTQDWKPQWMHHNFLPVLGLRLHSKVPPSPISQSQLSCFLGCGSEVSNVGFHVGRYNKRLISNLVSLRFFKLQKNGK